MEERFLNAVASRPQLFLHTCTVGTVPPGSHSGLEGLGSQLLPPSPITLWAQEEGQQRCMQRWGRMLGTEG